MPKTIEKDTSFEKGNEAHQKQKFMVTIWKKGAQRLGQRARGSNGDEIIRVKEKRP